MKTIYPFLIIVFVVTLNGCSSMKKIYQKERAEEIRHFKDTKEILFTNERIKTLPEPLKKHLQICGYVNKPIMQNADVYWKKSFIKLKPNKKWEKLKTKQFNSVNPISRMSYMKFSSMPFAGRDIYRNGKGEMKGKLFNLFTVVNGKGKEISQSALITIFCEFLLVPAYILQDYVNWEYVDEKTIKAVLTDNEFVVTGLFHFNSEGLFSQFETNDRFYENEKGEYVKTKFSAYVDSYQTIDEIRIPEKVRVVWHLPDSDYEYFKGTIERIEFDVTE